MIRISLAATLLLAACGGNPPARRDAGFVDAGNAYNNSLDNIYVGAGTGFRWLAPFGALQIDFAWPVSENPAVSDLELHLGFGATL